VTKQPIDFLFSPYRRQLLAVLFMRPDEQFHVRELDRLTGISAGSLHRELKAMAGAGLLRQERQGNLVLYQADRSCLIYDELASIFRKTIGLATLLSDALAQLANNIQFSFVFGSMASGNQVATSDLDICVLGDVKLIEVVKALGALQGSLNREINPVVMTSDEFLRQLSDDSRFAQRIVEEPKIFVIGDEGEFRKLTENRTTR